MIKNILVALDGSEQAEHSIPWAQAIAPSASLTLLQVVEPLDPTTLFVGGSNERNLESAAAYLKRVSERLSPRSEYVVRLGSAATGILDVAGETSADLIAVTTQGGAALERRVFGRTTEKLIHHSEIPLLVVPAWGDPPRSRRLERILVPVDGSEVSTAVIPLARWIARETDSVAILTHIVTASGKGEYALVDVERRIRDIASRIEPAAVLAKTVIRPGRVPDDILATARKEGADLIVMAAHGYGAVKRMLLGSVASRLIRETSVPVVIAKLGALQKLAEGSRI
ncbi:MAG TPA: universal stress protein [Planctomycetota bacterium]|nr:universal stress protein [Planctomycetota bacterium]